MRKDVEQTVKVDQLQNIMKVIATEKLKHQDVYYCMYGGKKTAVVK